MKKSFKLILCSVIAMTLIVSMQVCTMAAVTSQPVSSDMVSSHVASSYNAASSHVVSSNAAGSADLNDIAPYGTTGTPNPRTGAQSLAIPGVVAMLAAATAAVTLAGKKK